MIGGLNICVAIDDEAFVVETENDLLRLKQFVDETLDWLAAAPRLFPTNKQTPLPVDAQVTVNAQVPENIQAADEANTEDVEDTQQTDDDTEDSIDIEEDVSHLAKQSANGSASQPKRTIDYIVEALFIMELEGTMPFEGVKLAILHDKVVNLGWHSRSKKIANATRVLEIMARQNGHMVTISRRMMKLTETGREQAIFLLNQSRSVARPKVNEQNTFNEVFHVFMDDFEKVTNKLTPTAENDEG